MVEEIIDVIPQGLKYGSVKGWIKKHSESEAAQQQLFSTLQLLIGKNKVEEIILRGIDNCEKQEKEIVINQLHGHIIINQSRNIVVGNNDCKLTQIMELHENIRWNIFHFLKLEDIRWKCRKVNLQWYYYSYNAKCIDRLIINSEYISFLGDKDRNELWKNTRYCTQLIVNLKPHVGDKMEFSYLTPKSIDDSNFDSKIINILTNYLDAQNPNLNSLQKIDISVNDEQLFELCKVFNTLLDSLKFIEKLAKTRNENNNEKEILMDDCQSHSKKIIKMNVVVGNCVSLLLKWRKYDYEIDISNSIDKWAKVNGFMVHCSYLRGDAQVQYVYYTKLTQMLDLIMIEFDDFVQLSKKLIENNKQGHDNKIKIAINYLPTLCIIDNDKMGLKWKNTQLNLTKSKTMVDVLTRLKTFYQMKHIQFAIEFEIKYIDNNNNTDNNNNCPSLLSMIHNSKWIHLLIKIMTMLFYPKKYEKYQMISNNNNNGDCYIYKHYFDDIYNFKKSKKLPNVAGRAGVALWVTKLKKMFNNRIQLKLAINSITRVINLQISLLAEMDANILSWNIERLIWIAYHKNIRNTKCFFAMKKISKDIIKLILSFA